MTPTQAGVTVGNKALSQVGIHYTSNYSKYGNWWHPNWAYSLWCAMFVSWVFFQCFGAKDTIRLLGQQYAWSIGHAWTVSMLRYQRQHGTRVRSIADVRPGDLIFFKFPTFGDRNDAEVTHVDIAYATSINNGTLARTVGGNTPYPGTGGDQTAGRGVWKHLRHYYIVEIWRPPYSSVFKAAPSPQYAPRRIPLGMGLGKKSELSKIIQDIVNRPETGTLNSGDIAAVKRLQKNLGVTADGFFGPGTARAYLAASGTQREGWRGDTVRLIQYVAGVPFAQIDEIWGPNTSTWVKKAQGWAKIEKDAIFGADSRKELIRS